MSRSDERELSSWKEIAAYLGVGVRTAQEWERTRGLPVHRLPGVRGHVLASVAELGAWKRDGPPTPIPLSQDEGVGEGNTSQTEAPLLVSSTTVLEAPVNSSTRLRPRRFTSVWAWVTAGLPVLAAALGVLMWRHSHPPAQFRIEQDALVVSDAGGRELWRKTFQSLLVTQYATGRLVWLGDLDGKRVVLFVPVVATTPGRPLICYDSAGSELWRFTPGRTVHTATETFAPPFAVMQFVVTRRSKASAPRILVTSSHYLEYPCQIALLSPDGRLLREYWHSGQLNELLVSEVAGHLYLLAAGINNAAKAATLIALDPDTMSGASGEENGDYQLQGFAPGVEEARLLFPRSCFNRLLDPFAGVDFLTRDDDGLIISVYQRITPLGSTVYYHLNPDLTLKAMSVGSGFEQTHATLAATHVLNHGINPGEIEALRHIRYIRGPLH